MKRKQKGKKRLIACVMALLVLCTSFGFTETTWAGWDIKTSKTSVSAESREEIILDELPLAKGGVEESGLENSLPEGRGAEENGLEDRYPQEGGAEEGQNPSLNEAEQAEEQGLGLPSLFSSDMLPQAGRTTDLIPGSEAEIIQHGYAKYGGRSCGIFTVDGVRAFCLEHRKDTPAGGGTADAGFANPYDDPLIRTILYYTDGGPGLNEGPLAGMGLDEVIVRTSFALNKAYANDDNLTGDPDRVDGIALAQDYLNFCNTHLLYTSDVAFSQTDVSAYTEGDRQRTPDITLQADYRNQVSFWLPSDVGIHYNDTGAELSGQAVTVTGGQSFYLFKYLQAGGGTYQTGDLDGILNNFQPLVIDTGDESLQKIGILREYPNDSRTHLNVTWVEKGRARVIKTSANPELTDGHPCYSLEGAVYGLYDGSGQQVATAATNEAGIADFGEVNAGTYTLKELEAPMGYYRDENSYSVTVVPGQTAEVQVQDAPGRDTIGIELAKKSQDGNGTENVAPLSGAEFTVYYYAGYYTKENLPAREQAVRTWVLGTQEVEDPKGAIHYVCKLTEQYKVSGSDFYYIGGNPDPILPLGTIAIEETKEPEGYLLEGAYLTVKGGTEKIEGLYVTQILKDGELVSLVGGNEYSVYDRSIKGGLKAKKQDAETGSTPQGNAALGGAQFAIINQNDYAVVVEGKSYGKGETVKTLTTDDKGAVQTAADLLPYGNYLLKEIKAPTGYQLLGTPQQSFSITREGQVADLTGKPIQDEVIRGGVKVQKRDAETGGTTPQGNATLEGAQFAIINNSTQPVRVNGKTYQKGETVVTLTTDKNGAAQTAADLLPYGDYLLKETKAPNGYQLSGTLQQSFSIRENGKWVELTDSSHAIKDEVIRGGVKVQKRDAETGGTTPQGNATLEGAQFVIINNSAQAVQVDGKTYQKGETVATLTTDKKGAAQTASDLLPYGDYLLKETKAPAGYQLSGTLQQSFSITRDGQLADLTDSSHAIKDEVIRGGVKVQKRDAETGDSTPQGNATLAGAQFAIISNSTQPVRVNGKTYQKGETVATLTTDKNGAAQTAADLLPYGAYILKETKAPEGYQLSGTLQQSFTITENGKLADLTDSSHAIKDEVIRGGVKVQKRDLDTEEAVPQGDAALKGAQFTITNQSTYPVQVEGKLCQPGEAVKVLETDEKGAAQTAADLLPYGTYEIKETKAPEGYRLEGTLKRTFSITKDGQLIELTAPEDAILDAVIRGGVMIQKRDLESGDGTPQGGASLAGAVFTITNKSKQEVVVEGKRYKNGEVVKTITTNEQGVAKTAADLLPYGTYEIEETEAPEGYLPEGVLKRTFTIRKNGLLEDLTDKDQAIQNQVKRGDFELTKIDSDTQNALAGVSFRITSDTTGESHTFTTDANGFYSSASSWNEHSHNTNGGGPEDGLWFGLTAEGENVPADDGKGALPYDTYTIEELPSKANEGMNMYRGKLSIYRDRVTVDMGNIENKGVNIGTSAEEETSGSQYALAEEAVTIVDTVSYDGLTKGETYTVKGTLMDKQTGEPLIDGKGDPITAEKELKAKVATGSTKVEFTFDARGLEGRTIVVFEQIWQGKEQIAAHEDPGDEAQMIHFPGIRTSAADQRTGTHTAKAEEAAVLIDTVHYENLEPGKKYTLQAELMDRKTGKAYEAQGEPVQAQATFIPERSAGEARVEIAFDGREAAGRDLVVFETLKRGNTTLAVHQDLADEGQTVRFPKIATQARDGQTGTGSSQAGADTVIRDTVSYQNLHPGQTYTLRGVLMDKESGEPLQAEGKEITAERTFVPEQAEGESEVVFRFDSSALEGKAVVVYESLQAGGKEVAAHTDLEDEAQTIRFPGIRTTAQDKETGGHTGFPSKKTTITDTVTYTGLIPGKEYTVKGVLMDQESGKPLQAADKEIIAEKTFKAEKAEGNVELSFTFDSSTLAGKAVVVFERLYYEGKEIAVHTDLKDKDQTVEYQEPEIGTTAKDQETGEHTGFPSKKTTITDTVSYQGLIPGKEYTVKGVLMDKESGKPLKAAGKEITAEKTFKAEKAEGSIELTFTFDSSALAGKAVVAFERLYYEGREIAVHTDLKDKDQTVEYQTPEIGTTARDQETGGHIGFPSEKTTITDIVTYTGLIPGKEYTVKGVLMDKESGDLLKAAGKEITAEKTFKAEKAEGSIELTFTFDSSALSGKAVVAFERLYYEGREIAVHTDLKDKDQTVEYETPEIGTTARDQETGGRIAEPSEETTIIDTVTYKGLIPGKEYTVKGVLMDKESGKPLKVADKEITAEKIFKAEKAEGSIELTFTFDSRALAGKAVVVFERLYYEGREIAVHTDLEDQGQTVEYQEPETPDIPQTPKTPETPETPKTPKPPKTPKTGDDTPILPYAAAGVVSLLGILGCVYRTVKRKRK